MKIHLPRVFSRTFIKLKRLKCVVGALLYLFLYTSETKADSTLYSWAIDTRLVFPLLEHHDEKSGLAGGESIEMDVLRLKGSFRRDDAPATAIHVDLDFAGSSQQAECQRHIQNPVKQQRCKLVPTRRFSVEERFQNRIVGEFGLQEIPQKGWQGYVPTPLTFLETMDFDGPFDESQPAIKLVFAGDDEFSATITNDVSTAFPSVGEFTFTRTQPAVILEWKQLRCRWCGLAQWGDYDLNHSQFINLGLLTRLSSFHGFMNIGLDARERKYLYQKRRSMRWYGTLQGEYRLTSNHAASIALQGFRMFSRGLPGDEQTANKPGDVDQNLWQASLAYLWAPNVSKDWRYFFAVRRSVADVYASYPDGVIGLKQQYSVTCGLVGMLGQASVPGMN